MNVEWWLALVKEGGGYCAVLELGALIWLNKDRLRVISENADLRAQNIAKHAEVKELAERVITIATELKMFLFNERKT
jgi:hypothetical protein